MAFWTAYRRNVRFAKRMLRVTGAVMTLENAELRKVRCVMSCTCSAFC